MNGISKDALVGLIGVALGSVLGFFGSLIVMWFEGKREARRTADQRRYQWVKGHLDKIDDYISRLSSTSYELKNAAMGVLEWTPIWWQTPRLERPQITGTVQEYLDALGKALERGEPFRKEPPDILFGSLELQILGAVYELHQSFSHLLVACSLLSYERDLVIPQARDSNDLGPMQAWREHNYDEVINEYATFEKRYGRVVDAMHRALALESGSQPPALSERLRKALFSKERWKCWLGLAMVIILAFVGWAIARGIIRLP